MTLSPRLGWQRFGGQWLLACSLTKILEILLDGLAVFAISSAIGVPDNLLYLVSLVCFRLISGALGGAAQWWVLQQGMSSCRTWVLATSLGSAIALILVNGYARSSLIPCPTGIMGLMGATPISSLQQGISDAIMGLVLGIAQWLVLRRKLPQASGWIAASIVGLVAYGLGVSGLQRLLGTTGLDVSQSAWNPFFWAIAAVGFLAYGGITGAFWIWQLQTIRNQPNSFNERV